MGRNVSPASLLLIGMLLSETVFLVKKVKFIALLRRLAYARIGEHFSMEIHALSAIIQSTLIILLWSAWTAHKIRCTTLSWDHVLIAPLTNPYLMGEAVRPVLEVPPGISKTVNAITARMEKYSIVNRSSANAQLINFGRGASAHNAIFLNISIAKRKNARRALLGQPITSI